MINQQTVCARYDLTSVEQLVIGTAPLGPETSEALTRLYPNFNIRQGYGLTETSGLASMTAMHDIMVESAGSLLKGSKAKLLSREGNEITEYNSPGELWVTSGSIALGYHNNDKANEETFLTDENGERWLRTGDEAIFLKSQKGHDHIAITDRIKELIKVKGLQV
jgi:long-subunit acyl-CoA synthetase (AMP-forming)